jgi:hypothetical protein
VETKDPSIRSGEEMHLLLVHFLTTYSFSFESMFILTFKSEPTNTVNYSRLPVPLNIFTAHAEARGPDMSVRASNETENLIL